MSPSVSGIDLTLETPRAGFERRLIPDLVLDRWPLAAFQGAEEETSRPLGELMADASEMTADEFFVYQDDDSARSWNQDGWTPENGERMIHFLIADSPSDADSLQITMVIGRFTPEMADLYSALDRALRRPPGRPTEFARYPTLEAALRAAGYPSSRTQFYTLLDDVRQAFYPGWSEDELACHPRDAIQF